MDQSKKGQVPEKKKSFIAKLLDRLDKKMQEKAKNTSCCSSDKSKGGKCC